MGKRVIKFRSKRIDNNEWIIGNLVMVCDGESLRRYPCIVISYNHDTFNWFEVHSESVGQFTGLHDKNGKEIYEGDIDQYNCVCHFYNGCFVFGKIGNPSFIPLYDVNNIEIIGNIYENPELLSK